MKCVDLEVFCDNDEGMWFSAKERDDSKMQMERVNNENEGVEGVSAFCSCPSDGHQTARLTLHQSNRAEHDCDQRSHRREI